MTREVAIKAIQDFIGWFKEDSLIRKALEMAIQALEQNESAEEWYKLFVEKFESCEDAISRAELLKAMDTWDKFGCDANTKLVPYQDHYIPYIHYDDVIKCIKGMPSVNPQPCDDAIIREALVDDFIEWREKLEYTVGEDYSGVHLLNVAIQKIWGMPSVTQKYTVFHCPKCGYQDAREL